MQCAFLTLAQFAEALGVSKATADKTLLAHPGFGVAITKTQKRTTWRIPKVHVQRVENGETFESVAASAREKSSK